MKPKLLRTPEAMVILPGEGVILELPLIGCFVTAALYSAAAVITHAGPGMNDLTCRYHQELRPEPLAPARLIYLSLNLATATHWHRRRVEYEALAEDLVALLAVSLQIQPELIEHQVYLADAKMVLKLTAAGELAIQGLSLGDSP